MASRFERTFIANIAETIGHKKLLSQAHMQFYIRMSLLLEHHNNILYKYIH